MIDRARLLQISDEYTEYGMVEAVDIREPVGVDPLPDEWKEKLGVHELEPPAAYWVSDVNLCGPAMVGFKDKDVILDTAYFGRIDLLERNAPYFDYAMRSLNIPAITVPYAVSFVNVWSHNYFHWVLDIMPSLEFIMTLHDKPLILLQQNVPDYILETMEELKLHYDIQSSDHYYVEKLLVIPTRRHKGYIHPSATRHLREVAISVAYEEAFTSRNIYVSRNDASSRQVVNEEEIFEFLGNKGFSNVYAGKNSFAAQISMFRGAEVIIGSHGSGLANMVWADKPKVIELVSPEYTNPCLWLIAACMGWNYGYVIGEPSDKGYEFISIDVEKLEQTMEKIQ